MTLEKYITKMRRRGFRYALVERYDDGSWMLVFQRFSDSREVSCDDAKTLREAIAHCEQDWKEFGGFISHSIGADW